MHHRFLSPIFAITLALCLMGASSSEAAEELRVFDQWAPAYAGEETAVFLIRENFDGSQPFSVEVLSGPSKGTLSASLIMRYTPNPGASGDDTIVWRLTNGDQVAEATLTMQIKDPSQRNGDLIDILVNQSIYNELQMEVYRLAADLENEGYQARVVPWSTSSSVSAVWTHLSNTYHSTIDGDSGRLTGAILIGNMPRPKLEYYNDMVYWNMHDLVTSGTPSSTRRHIWVSRISASNTTYGNQATLIRRALDANHAYRNGQSRLPHDAYVYDARDTANQPRHTNTMLNVWPQVFALGEEDDRHSRMHFLPDRDDLNSAGADAFVAGGEIFDQRSHGNTGLYMSGAFRIAHLYRFIAQQRVILASSCDSGRDGGIVNQHLFTRGGAAIWTVGGTATTYGCYVFSKDETISNRAKRLLSQGLPWGSTLQHSMYIRADAFPYTVFYGDLSLPVRIAPPNALPVVSSFTSSASRVEAGQPVTFTVNYEDVDGTGEANAAVDFRHRIEWFLHNYDAGRNEPTLVSYCSQSATDKSASITYAYPQPGTYTVRVEVMDEWQARGWRELSIVVDPASSVASVTVEATQERACLENPAAWRFERSLSSNSLTVPLAFSGDAVIGDDVASLPEAITFSDGQTVVELPVHVLANDGRSSDRSLMVNLISGEGYSLGSPSSATMIIEAMPSITRLISMNPVSIEGTLVWFIDVDCETTEDNESGVIHFHGLSPQRQHVLHVQDIGAAQ